MEYQPWERYAHAQEYSNAGKRDLIWGWIVFGIGAAITLGTWATAEIGGSYWIMWGLIGIGLFGIFRGLYRKVKTSSVLGTRRRWVIISIGIVLALALGTFLTYLMGIIP